MLNFLLYMYTASEVTIYVHAIVHVEGWCVKKTTYFFVACVSACISVCDVSNMLLLTLLHDQAYDEHTHR